MAMKSVQKHALCLEIYGNSFIASISYDHAYGQAKHKRQMQILIGYQFADANFAESVGDTLQRIEHSSLKKVNRPLKVA